MSSVEGEAQKRSFAELFRESYSEGIAEGKTLGIAEGKTLGIAEGKDFGRRETLIRILALRFNGAEHWEELVESIPSESLDKATELAVTSQTHENAKGELTALLGH